MYLGKRIKELREQHGLLQRQLSAELEIDTPMYSKIERGERRAKREQVIKLAKIFNVDKEDLLTLWLASQILDVVKNKSEALNALKLVTQLYED
ncbi:MAG: helix-turn-helix transcriptional regulator [Clostridiaceae bacterium]|jgi:transcriptional regulator with XRE-family HTH domain|nr:helix-turn-helix transcriptional regulator [Clostridiaceae bacterium]